MTDNTAALPGAHAATRGLPAFDVRSPVPWAVRRAVNPGKRGTPELPR